MPGKKGFVEVTFSPLNRIGSFHKAVRVKTNAGDKFLKLVIFGQVTPTPNKLRIRMGNLRLKKRNINFRIVKDTETKIDTLPIKNSARKPLKITLKQKPPFLEIVSFPKILKPKERGEIITRIEPKDKKYYGHFIEDLIFTTSVDTFKVDAKIKVIVSIKEDFSRLSAQELQNAPEILFSERNFDLGTVEKGKSIVKTVTFKNSGKRDLLIRFINKNQDCRVLSYDKKVAAGKSGKITLKINPIPKFEDGKFLSVVTVVVNNPNKPETRLEFFGKIK